MIQITQERGSYTFLAILSLATHPLNLILRFYFIFLKHTNKRATQGLGPTVGGRRRARRGGGVGIPRAHDRYIVNTSFTLHYHEIKNGSSRKGNVSPIFAYCNFVIAAGALA